MRELQYPDTNLYYAKFDRFLPPVLLAIALLVASHPVAARVYRCADASGSVSYSQTPCTAAQTGAQMRGVGARKTTDREACAQVRNFASKSFGAIKQGAEPSRLIDKYGGPGYINPLTLNVINFVSGFRHSQDIASMKVSALAFNKCVNGGFGKLSITGLPPEMAPPPVDIPTQPPVAAQTPPPSPVIPTP
ncbi:uncharacterized protein DUF4124 [Thiogranum longum]|uniref:Uncharacterized protein DUF4124 n=1 Tax=Thiogranum longum TaxID=1537524 RepID=A0A4R1HE75_9GAMM|nr:DUF4124 domain-containing protein [Thiogranum longum]TCK18615.1 uncharacterized protein DUF4124 [Thiogranum longum]